MLRQSNIFVLKNKLKIKCLKCSSKNVLNGPPSVLKMFYQNFVYEKIFAYRDTFNIVTMMILCFIRLVEK